VKDLGTGIGTLVNGERIQDVELSVGDVVKIGNMELRFGRTDKTVRPASNIRFASELKGGVMATPAQAEGGRTMLAFDVEDDLPSSKAAEPTPETSQPRAVSADGTLEEAESDDPLGLSLDANMLMGDSGVRNLDDELGGEFEIGEMPPLAPAVNPAHAGHGEPPPPPPPPPAPAPTAANEVSAPIAPLAPAAGARARRTLVLEIEGPQAEVDMVLAVLDGKPVSVGQVQVRAKKLDFD
jgi:hypothetical protein